MAIRTLAAAFTALAFTVIFLLGPAVGLFSAYRDQTPSHWDPFKPLDLKAPSTLIQRWKIGWARDDGALCRQAIAAAGMTAPPLDDRAQSANCGLVDAVALRRLDGISMQTVDTRCAVALSLFLWERDVVQPAAQRFFGEPVARLLHFGSYSCRRIAGRSRWSQHAHANAVDVSGFRLKSGKVISVLKNWPEQSDASRFLRVVRAGACDHFNMVLGPDFNEAHKDHFHFDLGFWRGCR